MRNPDTSQLFLEACVETLEQCILAEKNGANRLELCADLSVGGLTPSRELLDSVMAAVKIPVMAMIRPRAGNFVCSAEEIEEMKRSILLCKTAGVAGVVFGCLTPDSRIDVAQTSELVPGTTTGAVDYDGRWALVEGAFDETAGGRPALVVDTAAGEPLPAPLGPVGLGFRFLAEPLEIQAE